MSELRTPVEGQLYYNNENKWQGTFYRDEGLNEPAKSDSVTWNDAVAWVNEEDEAVEKWAQYEDEVERTDERLEVEYDLALAKFEELSAEVALANTVNRV